MERLLVMGADTSEDHGDAVGSFVLGGSQFAGIAWHLQEEIPGNIEQLFVLNFDTYLKKVTLFNDAL